MSGTTTRSDEPRLSDLASHLAFPKGVIKGGYWRDVERTCRTKLGLTFDPWQQGAGKLILATDEDGMLVHTVGGVGMSLPRQVGKALDLDTELLTANRGWTTLRDVCVGDVVFHPSGQRTEVTEVHSVLEDRECFQVITTDGRSVVADADHLWTVTDKRRERGPRQSRCFETRTITTREMFSEGVSRYASGDRASRCDGQDYRTNEYRFVLPEQGSVDLPSSRLPIDPYLFGAWLGDGVSTQPRMASGDEDVDHWVEAIETAGFIPGPRRGRTCWDIGIGCDPGTGCHERSFGGKLRRLNVLGNKHIPDTYLLGSVSQRLALLQGLLDTDGHIDRRGVVEFCSTSDALADGVLFLVRSLGWRAGFHEGRASIGGRDCGPKYRVTFTPKLVDGMVPFRLPRKVQRVGVADGGKGRKTVSIKEIRPVMSRPVRCIKVDADDGLFLAGRDLVATHNTYLFMGIVFALCMIKPGLLVVWTSHHGKTTAETFLTMQGFAKSYKVQPYIEDTFKGSGDEEIRFVNGSRILFGAREFGFGRGIPGVDILMMDEAQILSELALQNMLATLNTSQFGLHCYVGTPPKPEDVRSGKSEVFSRMRAEGLDGEKAGNVEQLVWIEFSADANADLNDRKQWAKANPSFPHRTPVASILRMKKRLNEDGFRREGLGIWDDDGTVFNLRAWANPPILNREAPQPDRVCLSVAVSTDQKFSTIAVAGRINDEQSLVMYTYEAGMNWVVPMIVGLWNLRRIDEISLSGAAARVFEPELVLAGVEFKKVNAAEMGAACVAFQKDVKNAKVCHLGQPELDLAVANARIRMVGETQQWDRRDPRVDDSPLVGCSGALYRLGVNDSPMPMIL